MTNDKTSFFKPYRDDSFWKRGKVKLAPPTNMPPPPDPRGMDTVEDPAMEFFPKTRNDWRKKMVNMPRGAGVIDEAETENKMQVISIAETVDGKDIVHKKCIDSIFSADPKPSSYIMVERPRLNLNDDADDRYPKTAFESIIKNSHDSRNMRILSSQFEACTSVNIRPLTDGNSANTAFVSVFEDAEMKFLGRHPDQVERIVEGFIIDKSRLAKSFIPLFLTFMLLLLFSKKK
jgi:hypothetical protein